MVAVLEQELLSPLGRAGIGRAKQRKRIEDRNTLNGARQTLLRLHNWLPKPEHLLAVNRQTIATEGIAAIKPVTATERRATEHRSRRSQYHSRTVAREAGEKRFRFPVRAIAIGGRMWWKSGSDVVGVAGPVPHLESGEKQHVAAAQLPLQLGQEERI